MKITKVELIPVSSPLAKPLIMPNTYMTSADSVLMKLHTDEGIVGYGDTGCMSTWYQGETQDTIMGMIAHEIAPQILLGADPRNIERIVGRMDLLIKDNHHAKSLVDFALHDAKGKYYDMPVYQLLGGKSRDYVELGWVLSPGPVDDIVQEAKDALDAGYALIKQKIGLPTMEEDIEMIKGLRAGIGDSVRLVVDVNGFWNYGQALKGLKQLEDVGLEFIEQPLPRWDIVGMARLRQKVGTPIYADEAAEHMHNIREIIERDAADGLMIKVTKAGGLLKSQRWINMARLADMPVLAGCMPGSGLETSPAAHLLVADEWASQFTHENVGPVLNNHRFDTVRPPIENDMALNVPVFDGGKLYPNEGAGFGIDLNEEFIASHQTPGRTALVVE